MRLQLLFKLIERPRVVFEMHFHLAIIGFARKRTEPLQPRALTHGFVETPVRFIEIAVRPPKKNETQQNRGTEGDQKCPEPAILLKPIHGSSTGLRRSRCNS